MTAGEGRWIGSLRAVEHHHQPRADRIELCIDRHISAAHLPAVGVRSTSVVNDLVVPSLVDGLSVFPASLVAEI